ncbi:mitochondrial cytochrome c oxidase protein 20-like protein [Moniliophthora roreri MCA 2997]|uniref:Cytochrome c oxidase assembly protein COX20, mitochondrial n=1 Tax=Moniliophthora roreri (strain MCA 2997) TaxID=1381753 RepID=V2XRR6_MONRO|nr:mitochondrial cytochrome c oxidase protein 20-like protein [Moniliophthora roreri MCA 2997]
MSSSPGSSNDPTTDPTSNKQLPHYNGKLTHDALETVKHLGQVPCARNSLLTGLASGAGMAFIRGMSVAPITAGHWFAATFVVVSMGSWHLCQKQIADERQKVQQIIESSPKRVLKKDDDAGPLKQ